MTIYLAQTLSVLPPRHQKALRWFADAAGTVQRWPAPLDDETLLVTKAKGIYKPEWSKYALSVRQTIGGPYPDKEPLIRADGTWLYAYYQEGDFPQNRDREFTNRALMKCLEDKVPIGVMRQVRANPHVEYHVLGLALVTGWDGGYFYLEGFSRDGHTDDPGPQAELEFLSAQEEKAKYQAGHFDPQSVADARRRTVAAIVMRQGQSDFRQILLKAYNGRCAVTGWNVIEVLEAAHITPYLGPETNHPSNGLLLRSDIHALFDLGLLAIDPEMLIVVLAPRIRGSSYSDLHGNLVSIPMTDAMKPSIAALKLHRDWCGF